MTATTAPETSSSSATLTSPKIRTRSPCERRVRLTVDSGDSGVSEFEGRASGAGVGRSGSGLEKRSRRDVGVQIGEPQDRIGIPADPVAQLASADGDAVDRNRVGDLDQPHVVHPRLRCERHAAGERHDVVSLLDPVAQRPLLVVGGLLRGPVQQGGRDHAAT